MNGPLEQPSETDEMPLYGDAEIVAASGLALPSLRVLQAAGAIRAEKEAKEHGGFRRMWPMDAVLKASVGALMSEHFAWNIRTVAEAIARIHPWAWATFLPASVIMEKDLKQRIVQTSPEDWYLELIDRKFLFLRVPQSSLVEIPNAAPIQQNKLLGFVKPSEGFQMIPLSMGQKQGFAEIEKASGKAVAEKVRQIYRLAMAAHANCLSKTSLNASLQVRAAWRRLNGFEAHFVEEILQPKEGEKKNASQAASRSRTASRKRGGTGDNR